MTVQLTTSGDLWVAGTTGYRDPVTSPDDVSARSSTIASHTAKAAPQIDQAEARKDSRKLASGTRRRSGTNGASTEAANHIEH